MSIQFLGCVIIVVFVPSPVAHMGEESSELLYTVQWKSQTSQIIVSVNEVLMLYVGQTRDKDKDSSRPFQLYPPLKKQKDTLKGIIPNNIEPGDFDPANVDSNI